jgi:hypothetical protein
VRFGSKVGTPVDEDAVGGSSCCTAWLSGAGYAVAPARAFGSALIDPPVCGVAESASAAVVARPPGTDVPDCATAVFDTFDVLEDADGKITASNIATARNARAAIRSSVSRVRWMVMVRLDGPPG